MPDREAPSAEPSRGDRGGLVQTHSSGKRKRTVDDPEDDEHPPAPAGSLVGDRVVLLGLTDFLNSFDHHKKSAAATAATKQLDVNSKRVKELRSILCFLYHGLDSADMSVLAGSTTPGTYASSWLVHSHSQAASRIQGKILKFVAEQVKKGYELSLERKKDLTAMTPRERMESVWKPLFTTNQLDFAKKMWAPVTNIVDFAAIFKRLDGIDDTTNRLLKSWAYFVFHTWLVIADAEFRYRLAPKVAPNFDTKVEDGETIYDFWKGIADSLGPPDIEDLPIVVSAGSGTRPKRAKKAAEQEDR
ncbi:uncharacterized protein BKA78DRAFT_351290 [Phyllosticta capitalensis]